ncbi:MAG: multidrug ABC transporter permease [Methanolinea sp. SDB]|nr:MAG: multidrug ABC transporter permease [Methanolinea sp. SDB]
MDVIYTIWLRNIKRYLRSRSRIIGSLGMPLFFLVILGFGLNSVVTIPSISDNYVEFLVPGIVSMSVLFMSIFSGAQIIWDKQFGFLKETLVAPVTRIEIMLGQAFGGATTAMLQGTIILVLSLFIGLSIPEISGLLIAFGFMALIGVGFTSLGIAIASRMEDMNGFQLIMSFLIFPIFGLSGAMFPIESLPPMFRSLTLADPLTYGVEGIRFGLCGVSQIHPLTCLAVLLSFSTVMIFVGAFLFRKVKM